MFHFGLARVVSGVTDWDRLALLQDFPLEIPFCSHWYID